MRVFPSLTRRVSKKPQLQNLRVGLVCQEMSAGSALLRGVKGDIDIELGVLEPKILRLSQ